jgi:hypothetical protein
MYLICFILLHFIIFLWFILQHCSNSDSVMSKNGMIVNNDWESMCKEVVMTWQLQEVTEGNHETHQSDKGCPGHDLNPVFTR